MRHACMDDLWRSTLDSLLNRGAVSDSRIGGTREVLGFSTELSSPAHAWLWNPIRKLSAAYAGAELLWYLSGSDDATLIKAYAASYSSFLDDGIHAYGAYGARWKEGEQLRSAVRLLKEQPTTRQCVITCWRPGDLRTAVARGTKDMPCTLTLQLLLRDDELHMVVNMRSNDAWLGLPYDVWCFTRLQMLIAACVGCGVGSYWHRVGSMHLYEKDAERAREALAAMTPWQAPRCSRAGFDCVDEMERQVAKALATERTVRTSEATPEKRIEMIDNILKRDTILSESVACCAAKQLGIAPTWLDGRLR